MLTFARAVYEYCRFFGFVVGYLDSLCPCLETSVHVSISYIILPLSSWLPKWTLYMNHLLNRGHELIEEVVLYLVAKTQASGLKSYTGITISSSTINGWKCFQHVWETCIHNSEVSYETYDMWIYRLLLTIVFGTKEGLCLTFMMQKTVTLKGLWTKWTER